MGDYDDNPSIRLMGLWKKTSKNGLTYLQGGFTGSSSITIFPNTRKEKDTHPDYVVYINKKGVREAEARRSGTRDEEYAASDGRLPEDDIAF
jgi:uncharacterized protein (DUF736 family)